MATNVTQWKCRVESDQPLTVGDQFTLACDGDAVRFQKEKLSLRRPKDSPYMLRILKVENFNESSLKAVATTYVAGDQPLNVAGYGLTDGEQVIEFAPFTIPVKTVINQETNPEGKPYPAYGPLALSYPLWIWIAIALVGLVLAGIIFRLFRINRQRKAFLNELAAKSTALAPYHQFQKDLRQITRTLPVAQPEQWQPALSEQCIDKLDSSYDWFLAREFKIPAHKWSANLVHGEIKKIDRRLFKHAQKSLEVADRELRRAKKNFARMSLQDFQQLLEIVRKAADTIHLQRGQESLR